MWHRALMLPSTRMGLGHLSVGRVVDARTLVDDGEVLAGELAVRLGVEHEDVAREGCHYRPWEDERPHRQAQMRACSFRHSWAAMEEPV